MRIENFTGHWLAMMFYTEKKKNTYARVPATGLCEASINRPLLKSHILRESLHRSG